MYYSFDLNYENRRRIEFWYVKEKEMVTVWFEIFFIINFERRFDKIYSKCIKCRIILNNKFINMYIYIIVLIWIMGIENYRVVDELSFYYKF